MEGHALTNIKKMNCQNTEDVKRTVKELNVSFIQFWFPDVLGFLKSFAVTPSELDEGMTEGMGFDGSSIEGFARIQESDMIAKPDPTTFQLVPWRGMERPVARMFCDIIIRTERLMRETLAMFSRGSSRRSSSSTIKPVKQILQDIMAEAERTLDTLAKFKS